MREERKETLQKLCLPFRNKLIDLLYSIQPGHPGGSLSCTEILTALYYDCLLYTSWLRPCPGPAAEWCEKEEGKKWS